MLDESRLEFAGQTSMFEGILDLAPTATRLVVVASQPEEANFGKTEKELR
ncbi:MAG: hypothetical protein R3338_05000 [Thermoanaerobaculia bacterium]|nr:hypothetical protein [Thermoanaerobaculia bacterium]